MLGQASQGIAPDTEQVTLSLGSFSLTIPANSFVKKADKDDDHGKMDRDDRISTYHFTGVIAGCQSTRKSSRGRSTQSGSSSKAGRPISAS